jgi:two-component system, cell cycle sensor histidine kinase and response regulator CckA
LARLWAPQNKTSPEQFLDGWEGSPVPSARLEFHGQNGPLAFQVHISSFLDEGQKGFLLQLLPEPGPVVAEVPKPPPTVPDVPKPPPATEEPKRPAAEGASVQKQKLDCALQLARTVALDFNNALTSILGHTSLLLGQMQPDHPWRSSLLEVEKSAAKAAEIANDLGAFSLQEKEARGQTSGNLNLLLQRAVDFFQQNAAPPTLQIEWELSLERRLFTARFDEAKLQQAFVKILENAVESFAGNDPSFRGRISVQTRNHELEQPAQDRNVQLAPGAYISAEISDTGAGIAPGVFGRIFEPFFTTKGGTHRGLGLAWVYGVVTNHGGNVAISSQPGIGTSVRLYLPAEKRLVREEVPNKDDLSGNQLVLVVDDEDLLLTMSQTILESYGYHVLTANSGQRALELLGGPEKIDLVVTDLVMPAMSGRELIERIYQVCPQVSVLCTSGYVWQGTQDEDLPYLQKPFTAQELLLKVKQALSA